MARALAMVIDAQTRLPMAKCWGTGQTASSDGQFFPTTRQGEAMNLINAKYGNDPGIKAYAHVSDQYSPFATQVIPATVSEAPYILDGLLMNDAGKKIKEQYANTSGFTDLVFAATSLLGYCFHPRIRDLASKRLHVSELRAVPKELKGLTGDKIREAKIAENWPDVLRCIATMLSGRMQPSHLVKKLAARPRQHDLAIALWEIGRVERTLFIIEWLLDTDMQRCANIGLNKGEAHHALKGALRIGREGEIRDRSTEGQHFRNADRRHHLLEFQTARHRCGKTAKGGARLRARTPCPHITAWMGYAQTAPNFTSASLMPGSPLILPKTAPVWV